METRAL